MAKSDSIHVGVFGYAGCSAWIAAGMLEFFAIANVAARLERSRMRFDGHAVSADGRAVRASQGVRLTTRRAQRRYHALIVPPLWVDSRSEFDARTNELRRHLPLLQRLATRSGIVASACSGAVLLADAGLLDGHRATTCWWLAEWFGARYPRVELEASRLVVIDGDRWTAAAGTAYLHLCLDIVKKLAGERVATLAGRLALVEPRRGSQSPFLATQPVPENAERVVQRAAALVERRIATPLSVADLARELGTTERTLSRRFRSALGVPPLAYLQSRRIALAKRLLERDRDSLERIVGHCGYSDLASFRKLFTREVGMSPREYRSRFAR